MKTMNLNRSLDASPTVHTNNIHCTESECVLPGCINLKVQMMKLSTDMNKKKPQQGKSLRNGADQSTMMEFTESSESTDHFWDQDLQDVLNILGLDNYGNTHSSCYPANNAIVILDEGDQRPPALQHAFGEEANFFEVPQNIRQLPGKVPGNTNQPISTPSTSCKMDSAVFTTEASAFGVKRSRKNQAKLQAKYPDREETENSSPFKRKSRSPMQSASKLFGILSLILQALDGPLTTELEERYECVLQTTVIEIQNARRHLGTGQ